MKTCTMIKKGNELNKDIKSETLSRLRLELACVIRQTASRKATGPDEVPAELFKAGGGETECTEYVWRSGKRVSG